MTTPFNTPNIRTARSGDIPVWDAKINQWIPKAKDIVSENGTNITGASLRVGSTTVTSTGSFGPYSITFPASFVNIPVLVAWPQLASGGSFVVLSQAAVTISGFSFYMMGFAPGQVVVPNTQTVVIQWQAIGK